MGIIGGIGGWLGGTEGLSEVFEVGGFSELAFSIGVKACFLDRLVELVFGLLTHVLGVDSHLLSPLLF